jgi:ubiquinone biosynthesis protein COQ9
MSPDDAREKLLDAILPNVPFDGWTHKALSAGAADLDLDPLELDRLFPGGPADVIECFSARADRQMLQGLEGLELESMRVRDKVAAAVRLRLEALEPHREAVQRGLTFLGLPPNGALGLRCLYRTVDAVWHGIGDRSVDYNFYSKRLLLSGVYSSTLLYWLNDGSEDHQATWAFLDRRIGEVLKIGGSFGKTVGRLLELPERIVAAGRRRC